MISAPPRPFGSGHCDHALFYRYLLLFIGIPIEIEIEIIHKNTGKLDRLLSIGPLYLAIHDLWVSLARVSSTTYTYRHT
jgi:hypothetical protein